MLFYLILSNIHTEYPQLSCPQEVLPLLSRITAGKTLFPETMLDAVDVFGGNKGFGIHGRDGVIDLVFIFSHHAAVQNFYRAILSVG
jgi:hypothetical protein